MQHIAIMKKSWGLLPKILTGKKTIESRWYMNRYAPWDRIKKDETVFFKDSGEPVTIKTKVAKVEQYDKLNPEKARKLLNKYPVNDGLGIKKIEEFYLLFKNKKYCLIIFLKDAKKIIPFEIDKTGYGAMAAWICVKDVNKIIK